MEKVRNNLNKVIDRSPMQFACKTVGNFMQKNGTNCNILILGGSSDIGSN